MPLYDRVIERVTEDKEEDTRPRLLSRPFDAASEGISNAWNTLPEPVREGATNTANFIRNVFIDDPGSEWNQAILKKILTNVEGEEVGLQKFNALNESIARGDHDPIGQVFGAAIEGVSQVPTAVGLPPLDTRATRTGLALYTLGKIPMVPRTSKLYQSRIPVNKRIVNVNAKAIDDIFTMPPADFQTIIRLAKQSGINSMTLARRFNEQKGILKTYLQSKGRYGPLEGTQDLKGMDTTGGDQPVPEWFFNWKGTQFDKNRSDRLGLNAPTFDSPREKRYWFSKATYERTKDEVLAQGGTEVQANQIYRKISDNLKPKAKGGRGIVAAITELNNLAEAWEPGIIIKPTEVVRNGVTKWRYQFKDKDGTHRTWLFDKDHIQPVIDANRVGGGYIGADNPKNLEILLQQINVRKGNVFQLDQRILKEMGIPETFSEYINMELYPQNYKGMHVPQYWQENFQKIVLADYYEATKGVQSEAKKSAIMGSIVAKHAAFFKDPVIDRGLRKLDDALGQQVAKNMEESVAAGNEVPAWIGLLQKPPGGWNGNDPWWNNLSPEAQNNYRQMYDYRQRTIPMKQPYKRPPQGGKDYES
tara:strand:- start:42 stop:1808 length:1767 start_codon:yes stop_codon:yes gene_type:complete